MIKTHQNLKKKNGQDLKNVAEQFEAIFVHQMLKQARQGKLADGIFNSEAQDTFNNMLDIEYSQILSKKNNFGIAEALIKQFEPHLHLKKDK
jgi:flagellar protein FlgJ